MWCFSKFVDASAWTWNFVILIAEWWHIFLCSSLMNWCGNIKSSHHLQVVKEPVSQTSSWYIYQGERLFVLSFFPHLFSSSNFSFFFSLILEIKSKHMDHLCCFQLNCKRLILFVWNKMNGFIWLFHCKFYWLHQIIEVKTKKPSISTRKIWLNVQDLQKVRNNGMCWWYETRSGIIIFLC